MLILKYYVAQYYMFFNCCFFIEITMTNKNRIVIATMMIAVFAVGFSVQNADALQYHAVHSMVSTGIGGPYPEMWGIKSTYIADNTSVSTGTLVSPTWVVLDTGIYREVGWLDSSSGDFHSYWAIDGQAKTPTGSVTDGTSYNWEVSNINEDWTWEMSAPGLTKTWTDFSYGDEANTILTGMEYSSQSITLPTITYSSQKVYVNGAWENWDDQNNGAVGSLDESDSYVLECGNDYTSEHGEGSGPSSC